MPRVKPGGWRHNQIHQEDPVARACVESFLRKLQTSDIPRFIKTMEDDDLVTIIGFFDCFCIKISHAILTLFGLKQQEYRLEVGDPLYRFGRKQILKEWFGEGSPLFGNIEETFKILNQKVPRYINNDTMSGPNALRKVEDLL